MQNPKMKKDEISLPLSNSEKKDLVIIFILSGLGCGFIPLVPGSFASAVIALLPILFEVFTNKLLLLLLFFLTSFCCLYYGKLAETLWQAKDPKQVTLDEFSGMLLALLLLLHFNLLNIIFLFIFFRFFDVFKIYPANIAEKFPAGLGILFDDLVAGLYSAITVNALCLIV